MTLLLKAGLLVTGEQELENGWVMARDGVIAEVGSGPAPKADEVIDEPNCVAMPGLVNAHDHMYQWATRGYVPDGTDRQVCDFLGRSQDCGGARPHRIRRRLLKDTPR